MWGFGDIWFYMKYEKENYLIWVIFMFLVVFFILWMIKINSEILILSMMKGFFYDILLIIWFIEYIIKGYIFWEK